MTRDERARRELADKVKDAADAGMGEMVAALRTAAFIDDDRQSFTAAMDAAKASAQEVLTGVSALVLASGLRAPANGHEPTAVIYNEASAFFAVRDRLANVERLLAEASDDMGTSTLGFHRVRDARAELRAILGGEGQ